MAEEGKTAAASSEPAGEEKASEPAPEPAKEMRACVLTGFGGLKTVKVQKKPEPTAGEGEVLIRVRAGGLNFLDLMVRQGAIDNPPKTPIIMGFECAGEIEAVGEGVQDLKVGDHVMALSEFCAWAELVAVPAKHVYKMAAGMTFHEAAAIPLNYAVAYIMLFEIGNLRAGKSVLVHSVGGGVGHAVSQLCKTLDNVTLFGTASKGKEEAIKENVTHLFDHSIDYVQEIRKISPEGVDLVLDCLCGDDANKGYTLLKPMGKYILYGTSNIVTGETKSLFSLAKSWWQVDKVSPIKLYDENRFIGGIMLRHLLFRQGQHEYVRTIMEKVVALFTAGKIRPHIDSTWAYEDVQEGMQKMHDRKNIGKILLDPTQEPKPKDVKKPAEAAPDAAANGEKDSKNEGSPEGQETQE
ncbi:PREDICTED: LOW QUALITY PROTEIN: synaptic vesicle membrane protein VAT-1 homolog-like [Priapulus caudatus]|uniref:LOW QUALITY PROTEIN: synaptic vesicle membrane protein VAT-1 homolog-like n=1 Tax=Priapulus caudatus TaxID=37621 RepID=A0ABM1DW92_PRICU|nr:PREDICTED: LOW QUALITY PROTEIN: synaptic vesicle membrane protein VAT-1 homolog-like [Priapulus caudatus]